MRTDQINTDPFQSHAQRQAISRTVVNQPLKAFPRSSAMNSRRANRLQRILDQLRVMRRRGSNAYPDWYALTICYRHNFCSLAAFGFAEASSLFLLAKTSYRQKPLPSLNDLVHLTFRGMYAKYQSKRSALAIRLYAASTRSLMENAWAYPSSARR